MTNKPEDLDDDVDFTVVLTLAALDDLNAILTREMQGHHNRMESYLLGHDVAVSAERATECARAAYRTRQLRAAINQATPTK